MRPWAHRGRGRSTPSGGLARRLNVRVVPHLQFKYDPSVERGARLSQLIDQAVAEDTKRNESTKPKKRRK